jgi:hypothetical protein
MASAKLSELLDDLTGKTPVAADKIPLLDSADGFVFDTTTVGALRVAPVSAVTATAAPAAADSGTVYTNQGDTDGATVTLPAAAAGLRFSFIVQAAQTLTITAGAGDTIRIAADVTAAAGSITCATVGCALTLVAIDATEWVALAAVGTWTFP